MRLTILLLMLGLLPLTALAQETGDDDDTGEVDESIITEVEGTGNKVIVIEELVINIDTGDVMANREGGEAMGLVHRLLDMLGGGPGPEMMMDEMPMPHPGRPGMGPDNFHRPFQPRMGPGPSHGPRPEIGPPHMRSPHGPGGPRVSDNVHGMPPQRPKMMGPGGMHGGMMDQMHGEMMQPGGMHGGMDPAFMEFMMQIGRLAMENPEFRERLHDLFAEFMHDPGMHHPGPGSPHAGAR